MVVVDIDNFKKVNDTYGHENGNEVLVALARLMLDICDPSVYLSRYGGEEFALIFSEYHDSQAKEVMEQIRIEFSKTGYTFLPTGGIKRGKNQSYILYNDINMQSECQKWRLREHKINQQLSEITNRYSGDY